MRGRQTVIRLRAPKTDDRYGNDTRDWDNAVELPIPGCSLQRLEGTANLTATENVQTGSVITRWQLFSPRTKPLLSSDRIRYDGQVYEIEGDVQRGDPTARYDYNRCVLKRSGAADDQEE